MVPTEQFRQHIELPSAIPFRHPLVSPDGGSIGDVRELEAGDSLIVDTEAIDEVTG
jgi:hypothetical protein